MTLVCSDTSKRYIWATNDGHSPQVGVKLDLNGLCTHMHTRGPYTFTSVFVNAFVHVYDERDTSKAVP